MLDEGGLLTVPEAPREPHGLRAGLVGRAGRDRRLLLLLGRRELGGVVVLAGDRILELAHPLAQRAPHLRQPLRPEDEEHDEEEDENLPDTDAERHGLRVAPRLAGNGRLPWVTKRRENPLRERDTDRTKWLCWNSKTCTSRSRTEPRSSRASISLSAQARSMR